MYFKLTKTGHLRNIGGTFGPVCSGLVCLRLEFRCKSLSAPQCLSNQTHTPNLLETRRMDDTEVMDALDLEAALERRDATIARLEAEIAELKDGIAQLQEIVNSDASEEERLRAENASLKAEVERQRATLAAIEKLALQASISSCTCLTKTPDITFHNPGCRYVLLQYIVDQCEESRAALSPLSEAPDMTAVNKKPLSEWGCRELARAAGISPTTASRVLRGETVLDAGTIVAVLKVTGHCLCCGRQEPRT